jgi:hypothetical protein
MSSLLNDTLDLIQQPPLTVKELLSKRKLTSQDKAYAISLIKSC